MVEFGKWMTGAGLVAFGAISLGYGSGMMWRAWVAQSGILVPEQKANLMFVAMMSVGAYSLLVALVCRALARS